MTDESAHCFLELLMGCDSFSIKLEPRNYKATINLIPAVIAAERPSSILSGVSGALKHDTDIILDNDF